MPLRDHFRSPLDDQFHWESMHVTWLAMIVAGLRGKLPAGYFAEPWIISGREEMIEPPVETDLGGGEFYEVRLYDRQRRAHLVAAVELVSPLNKDRPESRREFVARCAQLLRDRVSVVMVDIVTTHAPNLYTELLDFLDSSDPRFGSESLYSTACRMTKQAGKWRLDAWAYSLGLNERLPTMPLWLADDLAIPLDLEASYEESCRALGIA